MWLAARSSIELINAYESYESFAETVGGGAGLL